MSDELSARLHEFAADHETPPALSGAQVRARAVRRSRRRTAVALGAAAATVALAVFALTLGLAGDSADDGKQRQIPAAPPAVPPSSVTSPVPSPPAGAVPVAGTIDLGGRTLTAGDRVMPMASGFDKNPTFDGPLTISEKHEKKVLTVSNRTDRTRYNAVIAYAVELRDARNEPVYAGTSLSYNAEGIGTYDTSDGWIALDQADAKWFYDYAKPGTVLSVTGTRS